MKIEGIEEVVLREMIMIT